MDDGQPAAARAKCGEAPAYFIRRQETEAVRLSRELRAMAVLVERHREEFDALVSGLEDTVNLNAYRRDRQVRRGGH